MNGVIDVNVCYLNGTMKSAEQLKRQPLIILSLGDEMQMTSDNLLYGDEGEMMYKQILDVWMPGLI